MTHGKHLMARATSVVMLLLMGAATIAGAQARARTPGRMPRGTPEAKGTPGMNSMMSGPHHVLTKAYRDNLISFARVLRGHVALTKNVDVGLARPAVAEMRRSFDQMQLHHKAQMAEMGDQMMADTSAAETSMAEKKMGGMKMDDRTKPSMATSMQAMEVHFTALNEHLGALEVEVNAGMPDAAKISLHLTEILKHCAAMSSVCGTTKPHHMK